MKKALLVTPYYDPNIVGGAEISMQLMAENLSDKADVLTFGLADNHRVLNGVDVYEINLPLYTNHWAAPLDGTRIPARSKIEFHLSELWPSSKNVKRYSDFFCDHDYAVIILNSNEDVMDRPSLWKAAHESGTRVVLTLRDNLLLKKIVGGFDCSGIFRSRIKGQLKWIDQFVAPSQYMIDLYAKYGMTKAHSQVIPNSVDVGSVRRVSFANKSGVIYAGSLTEQKGILTLIEATKLLDAGGVHVSNSSDVVRLRKSAWPRVMWRCMRGSRAASYTTKSRLRKCSSCRPSGPRHSVACWSRQCGAGLLRLAAMPAEFPRCSTTIVDTSSRLGTCMNSQTALTGFWGSPRMSMLRNLGRLRSRSSAFHWNATSTPGRR